MIGDL
jgi:hypothetical protein